MAPVAWSSSLWMGVLGGRYNLGARSDGVVVWRPVSDALNGPKVESLDTQGETIMAITPEQIDAIAQGFTNLAQQIEAVLPLNVQRDMNFAIMAFNMAEAATMSFLKQLQTKGH